MVWDQKVISLDWIAPDQLLANPRNARRHPAGQREALREMIGKVGFVAPLIVNSVTGMLLDGHARVEEALSAGVELLPVVTVELAEGDEAAFLAGFDAVGMLARWDHGLLGELVGEAQFGDGELRDLLTKEVNRGDHAALAEMAISSPAVPFCEVGQVWECYSPGGMVHRVLCGDSSDVGLVERLFGGRESSGMVSDPPYGISVETGAEFRTAMHGRGSEARAISGDSKEMVQSVWQEVFKTWMGHQADGACYYIWSGKSEELRLLMNALTEIGLQIKGTIIWDKGSLVLSRLDHKYQHEICLYCWVPGESHNFVGPSNETSVWQYPRPHSSKDHPTMKPVDLIRRNVRNIIPPGEIVADPFLGSGTTLLAAEVEGRACYGAELEPKYVDVALRRWQEITAVQPVLAGTDISHDFLGS